MAETKRSTVYFDSRVYRALKIKAAVTDESISDLVNDAVRESLREDDLDLALARERLRRPEKARSFAEFVRDLKRQGRL